MREFTLKKTPFSFYVRIALSETPINSFLDSYFMREPTHGFILDESFAHRG